VASAGCRGTDLGACRRKTRSAVFLRTHTGIGVRYSAAMTTFKPYNPDQPFLLPPVLQDWLPEDHPAAFIRVPVPRPAESGAVFHFFPCTRRL